MATRLGRAAAFAVFDRGSTPVALLGFLVRGGIVLILLPSAVVPSVLQITGMAGPRAITITGDITPWLLGILVGGAIVGLAWLLLACLVGSLTDSWLVAMALRPAAPGAPVRLPLPNRRLLARLVVIRLLCLVPLAVALYWAGTRLYDAAYSEWISPSDLAAPLVLRVVLAAADAVAVVVAVWLACETLAAVAVRRQLMLGRGVWRSLAEAARQIALRPVSTLVTTAVAHAGSAAAVVGTMVLTAVAFDWCRSAARAAQPMAFAAATLALALAWAIALAVSGVASAWRSAAITNEVAEAVQGR